MSTANPRPFKQVDVFTAVALKGNPVAVILDAQGLSAEQMQAIANWTNLSETTFVSPATDASADYSVRIFTPKSELPFAGHPTLGTAHAVIEAGLAMPKNGKVVQQCAVGLVEVSVAGTGLSFRLPRYAYEEAPEASQLAAALGEGAIKGAPQIVNVGPRWVIAELASAETVEQLQPDLQILADYDRAQSTTGMTVYAEKPDGGIVVRSFAPADGIAEDPVCGSGNGAVAAYRLKAQQVSAGSEYVASQGRQVGRDGNVRVRIEEDAIHVGGDCVTVVDGTFWI
ncbi:PhzF family phenazine biosynthesis protein [Sphingorhabdus buctiana]|jgi:PhzF family phenazine biosynthesis protein|uniref:PhzF family phenazine biosynthesis protein n=1 Tax=Sphingorhabdus buctiana TaxID=1508805 RepID=A0ABW4MEM0_9SPHN